MITYIGLHIATHAKGTLKLCAFPCQGETRTGAKAEFLIEWSQTNENGVRLIMIVPRRVL